MSNKRFLIEDIGNEKLIYDQVEHTAHCLAPSAVKKWVKARTNVARRAVLAGAVAGVFTIVAPVVAQAASTCLAKCKIGDFGKDCEKNGTCSGKCFLGTCR